MPNLKLNFRGSVEGHIWLKCRLGRHCGHVLNSIAKVPAFGSPKGGVGFIGVALA